MNQSAPRGEGRSSRTAPGSKRGGVLVRLVAVGLFGWGSSADAAEPPAPLTLSAAAVEALAANPSLLGARAAVEGAEAARDEAVAAFFPRARAIAATTEGDDPVYVFGTLLRQGRFGAEHFDPAYLNDPPELGNRRIGLEVEWRVFDGFSRLSGLERAGEELLRERAGLTEAGQQLLAGVVAAYWSAVVAEERRGVAEAAVRAAESQTAAMRDRFEQQLLVRSDLLSAEVRLAELRQQLGEAAGAAAVAREALAALLGRTGGELPPLVREVPRPNAVEPSLDSALAEGLAKRAALAGADAAVRAAGKARSAAGGAFLPKVDLFGSWERNAESWSDWNDTHRVIGAALTVPLADPGRLARVRSAGAAMAAAEAQALAARSRVRLEIVTAWERSRAARERLVVAEKAAEQAEEADRILAERYREGLTTIGERLRGEATLLASRLAVLSARQDAIVFGAELARATGGLVDVRSFE